MWLEALKINIFGSKAHILKILLEILAFCKFLLHLVDISKHVLGKYFLQFGSFCSIHWIVEKLMLNRTQFPSLGIFVFKKIGN